MTIPLIVLGLLLLAVVAQSGRSGLQTRHLRCFENPLSHQLHRESFPVLRPSL